VSGCYKCGRENHISRDCPSGGSGGASRAQGTCSLLLLLSLILLQLFEIIDYCQQIRHYLVIVIYVALFVVIVQLLFVIKSQPYMIEKYLQNT